VLAAAEVPREFDARFDARVKAYRYRMWNAHVLNPFERAYAWHLPPPLLDVAAMAEGARLLEGLNDFAAFQGAGSETQGSQRTIFSSRVVRESGANLVTYDVSGDGFLRYMVRNIVGSLVEVGRGRHEPQWIADLMASRDRSQGGQTAPAHGLFLMSVGYA
jgi:tRNA pseudouridine38-40 synthase